METEPPFPSGTQVAPLNPKKRKPDNRNDPNKRARKDVTDTLVRESIAMKKASEANNISTPTALNAAILNIVQGQKDALERLSKSPLRQYRSFYRRPYVPRARARATKRYYKKGPPGTTKKVFFKDLVTILYNGLYTPDESFNVKNVKDQTLTAIGGAKHSAISISGMHHIIPAQMSSWEKESAGFKVFQVLSATYRFEPIHSEHLMEDPGEVVIVVDRTDYAKEQNLQDYMQMMESPSRKVFQANRPFKVTFKPALLETVQVHNGSNNDENPVYKQCYDQPLVITPTSANTGFPGIRYSWMRRYYTKNKNEEVKANQGLKVSLSLKVLFKKV